MANSVNVGQRIAGAAGFYSAGLMEEGLAIPAPSSYAGVVEILFAA